MKEKAMEEQRIAGYRLCEKIGEGAMGSVYLAKAIANNKEVALKVLSPDLAQDPMFVARFLREATNATKLKKHPNIVEAYDWGQYNQTYYFAMEYVRGKSLAMLLLEQGKLSERMALFIAIKIAYALNHANKYSIVHRDIKPENVLISLDGAIKLCDLGLAKDLTWDGSLSREGVMLGTACYAAPEQIMGKLEVDSRADIYALGITLYHMLTGQSPLDGKKPHELAMLYAANKPAFNVAANKDLSAPIVKVLQKMTAVNPDQRYKDTKALLEDLEGLYWGKTLQQPKNPTESHNSQKTEKNIVQNTKNTTMLLPKKKPTQKIEKNIVQNTKNTTMLLSKKQAKDILSVCYTHRWKIIVTVEILVLAWILYCIVPYFIER